MKIVAVYAGLLALLFVVLSIRVIGVRRAAKVPLGDGGNSDLLRRLRVQGNFAEYVPLGLVLMLLVELQGFPGWLVHAIGAPLLLGRLAHAYGVSQTPENFAIRVFGMALTFTALISGAIINLAGGTLLGLLTQQ